jgi:hypothetical protein
LEANGLELGSSMLISYTPCVGEVDGNALDGEKSAGGFQNKLGGGGVALDV